MFLKSLNAVLILNTFYVPKVFGKILLFGSLVLHRVQTFVNIFFHYRIRHAQEQNKGLHII